VAHAVTPSARAGPPDSGAGSSPFCARRWRDSIP
jgi:hypothetical protein